jgi:hypothetical protein
MGQNLPSQRIFFLCTSAQPFRKAGKFIGKFGKGSSRSPLDPSRPLEFNQISAGRRFADRKSGTDLLEGEVALVLQKIGQQLPARLDHIFWNSHQSKS